MRVLIACEFSGAVRSAFRSLGHDAWSCDLLPAEDGGPHLQGDALDAAYLGQWDLMVAHPPCTLLTRTGARWWRGREAEQAEAIAFVRELLAAPIERIAIENPPGILSTALRPPDQYIQPWQHGHPETKQTGLWLKNLPPIQPTIDVYDVMMGLPRKTRSRVHFVRPGPERWKKRSRTLPGVALAMAAYWGGLFA